MRTLCAFEPRRSAILLIGGDKTGDDRDTILAELSQAHADLVTEVTHIDITRYGHAMAVPVPNNIVQVGIQSLWGMRKQLHISEQHQITHERINFAHSVWVGYSGFEEAFALGHWAACNGRFPTDR